MLGRVHGSHLKFEGFMACRCTKILCDHCIRVGLRSFVLETCSVFVMWSTTILMIESEQASETVMFEPNFDVVYQPIGFYFMVFSLSHCPHLLMGEQRFALHFLLSECHY